MELGQMQNVINYSERLGEKSVSEHPYYPMPEEGFSFFEIQTPPKNLTPQKPKGPLNPANFETPFIFQTQNGHPIT